MARRIEVEIVGDSRSLERAFKRSEASAQKFSVQMRGIGRSFAAASGGIFAGASVVAGFKASIQAASDLNEEMSKTNVVFGRSADAVVAWSQTTVRAMGLSQRQALGTASSFGALLQPLGITGTVAAQQSEKLTQLGADLASFYNTNVQDALDAIKSGLVGEQEPLRRYGALLSETRVQQEAMAQTGKKHAAQLTNQEKVLARIKIMFQDTAQAQGDFARTSGGLANQQRILSANIDQFATNLGKTYIPIVNRATGALNEFFDVMSGDRAAGAGTQLQKGTPLETVLVPALAKQIRQMQGRGAGGKQILAALRARVGTSGQAQDLIGEAFVFARRGGDPQLKARIRKQVRERAEGTGKIVKDEVQKVSRKQLAQRAGQRNQWFDAMIGRQQDRAQDLGLRKRLARLREIAGEIQKRIANTRDPTRRLNLQDQLLSVTRDERDVQQQITDQIQRGNQALKDRAQSIKSAVLSQLQMKQDATENQRALQDANAQLRLARQIGGPIGIQAASRVVSDARFRTLQGQLAGAPAALQGGQFALGGITVNVHGVTDPEKVARHVVAVIERRRRHTSTSTRGPTVDSSAPR